MIFADNAGKSSRRYKRRGFTYVKRFGLMDNRDSMSSNSAAETASESTESESSCPDRYAEPRY